MGEAKVRGVEKVTIQRAKLLAEFLVAAFAVNTISDNRMTNRGEVYPDLMCAACLDPDLQKTKPAEAFDYPIFGVRRPSSQKLVTFDLRWLRAVYRPSAACVFGWRLHGVVRPCCDCG